MGGWWFKVKDEFAAYVKPYAGKPITYVEIGCWKGASAEWMARNILTHPDSRGYGIDPYTPLPKHDQAHMNVVRKAALEMLKPYPNWKWVRKPSLEALRQWSTPIDLLYIDGVHEAPYALMDFTAAWHCLRVGSLVIFDDYAIGCRKPLPCVPEAVEAVLKAFFGYVDVVGTPNHQFALRILHKDPKAVREFVRGAKRHYRTWGRRRRQKLLA